MALTKGYRLVLDTDSSDETFAVEGEELLILSRHSGGTWQLDLLDPEGIKVETLRTFDSNGNQRIAVPAGTQFRLHGGTIGAKAWVGSIYTEAAGRLI